MIRQNIFAVCEQVILHKEQPGVVSLIGIFNGISMKAAPGQPIPENALAPKQWMIFTSWIAEQSDIGKEYNLHTQIFYPNKKQFGQTSIEQITFSVEGRSQAVARIGGFPIGQQGLYTIRTWIEHNSQTVFEPSELALEVKIIKEPSEDKS